MPTDTPATGNPAPLEAIARLFLALTPAEQEEAAEGVLRFASDKASEAHARRVAALSPEEKMKLAEQVERIKAWEEEMIARGEYEDLTLEEQEELEAAEAEGPATDGNTLYRFLGLDDTRGRAQAAGLGAFERVTELLFDLDEAGREAVERGILTNYLGARPNPATP